MTRKIPSTITEEVRVFEILRVNVSKIYPGKHLSEVIYINQGCFKVVI